MYPIWYFQLLFVPLLVQTLKRIIMKQVDEGLYIINQEHDLVHSQDDEDREGKGWYIQKSFPKPVWSKTSQLFATKQEAIEALKRGKLKFD